MSPAEALGRGEADGVEQPVEAVPSARRGPTPAAASCSGLVTSISSTSGVSGSLRAVRRVSESARPAPERTISAPSSLGQAGHAEGQGGVGEDAGDEDPLAVEDAHGPEATNDDWAPTSDGPSGPIGVAGAGGCTGACGRV